MMMETDSGLKRPAGQAFASLTVAVEYQQLTVISDLSALGVVGGKLLEFGAEGSFRTLGSRSSSCSSATNCGYCIAAAVGSFSAAAVNRVGDPQLP